MCPQSSSKIAMAKSDIFVVQKAKNVLGATIVGKNAHLTGDVMEIIFSPASAHGANNRQQVCTIAPTSWTLFFLLVSVHVDKCGCDAQDLCDSAEQGGMIAGCRGGRVDERCFSRVYGHPSLSSCNRANRTAALCCPVISFGLFS